MAVENYLDLHWGHIIIGENALVQYANEGATTILNDRTMVGKNIFQVLPWLRTNWLRDLLPRLVRTSISNKFLLDIVADKDSEVWRHIYFRRFEEYSDTELLWCEVADSIIGVQRFIDTSYDGMIVENGKGKVLAVNVAFLHISGLTKEDLIGKQIQQLIEEGLVPHACSLQACQQKKTCSANVRYPNGKEGVVSSTPLYDQAGRVIRVISNVRDLSELNALREQNQTSDRQAGRFQSKLEATPVSNFDEYRNLTRNRTMKCVYDLIPKVANTNLQLLVTGESGVGKTALAKYVHMMSDRNDQGSFIHVNCSAIPDSLMESELFGYEEGAFTGAKRSKPGLFELADKGTLFLDEIGDMPLPLQTKILNVLQENKFYRVGGAKELTVDVRIIAATNMDLEQLIKKGTFRQDLYYRLNVIPLRIPSLAERCDDIPLLINYYLDKCNKRYKCSKKLSDEVLEVLLQYNWPGNIREIITVIERMVVLIDASTIKLKHLAEFEENSGLSMFIKAPVEENHYEQQIWQPGRSLKDTIRNLEEEIIEEAILHCGSLKMASQKLGVDVTTVSRKRKKNLAI